MDSYSRFLTIFMFLGISFIFSIGDTISETYAAEPITPRYVQSFHRTRWQDYVPDFVFPTESPTENPTERPARIQLAMSEKLQELPPYNIEINDTISRQRCEHYARQVDFYTGIKCWTGTPFIKNVTNGTYEIHHIIVGTQTKVDEFPHMVALGKYNLDRTFILMCGGTLISHTWILTAAHCTYGSNGSPSHVRLGFHKLSDKNTGVIVAIKKMIRHPNYRPPLMYADIALIELVNAVTFTASIRPACIYETFQYYLPRTWWISGWGVTEFAGDLSDPLLKAEVDIINNLDCTKAYQNVREVPNGISPSMLCAGDARGNWSSDTCQGDSGGPLQIPSVLYPCLQNVIGVTSLGLGCAIINTPGIYTAVPFYLSWIENIVWPEN